MHEFNWSIVDDPDFHRQLRIRNAADREDAIQDAYLKLKQLGKPVTRPLLHTTTVNCHKDRVKAQRRRRARELRLAITPACHDCQQPYTQCIDSDSSLQWPRDSDVNDPSANLERRETRAAIRRAVRAAHLSRDHRCALWAWMRNRLSKFAIRRGVPQVTARGWAMRARDALRPHLKREGLGPD